MARYAGNFHQLGPLGRVGLVVAMCVCFFPCFFISLFFCFSDVPFSCIFFLRPLIGPQITWPDPGLSLVHGRGRSIIEQPRPQLFNHWTAAPAAVQRLNGCARSCSTIERPPPKSVGIPKFQTLYNSTISLKDYLSIGASIRIGWESWCLPYAGFFSFCGGLGPSAKAVFLIQNIRKKSKNI